MNLDLSLIQTFVKVAENRSLRVVADILDISPAAVSKHITRLEESLKVQLLHRSTRSITLTEIGQDFYEQSLRILAEVDIGTALIQRDREVPEGLLKVLSGRHFAQKYLIPYISQFLDTYPHIKITLDLSERIPNFDEELIDVVVGMSRSLPGNPIQKRIGSTHYLYCASKEYCQKYGVPETIDQLTSHRIISHSMRTWEQNEVAPFLAVNDAETIAQLVLQGIGVAKLHHYVVEDAIKNGDLIALFPSKKNEGLPLYAAYPNRRFVPSKVRAFLNFLETKMRKE